MLQYPFQSSKKLRQYYFSLGTFLLFLILPSDSFAHVKWFSGFDFLERSKSIATVANTTYVGLVLLSLIVISALILLDDKIKAANWNKVLNNWLDKQQHCSPHIIRVATFTVLFIAWVNETILTPELQADSVLLPWVQFVIGILILIPSTSATAGLLLIGLYVYCVLVFGPFYMLDYFHFVGIGIYIATIQLKNKKLVKISIPALYITLGFSLVWLAFEKLYYPSWGLQLLEENPKLTMGLPSQFFLQAAAFVEFGLGFLMLFGALERPLAAIITIVFIMTSLVFGKIEVIGHTSLHAMLLVFIFEGTSKSYQPPINRMSTVSKKLIVGIASYLVLSTSLLFAYKGVSILQYKNALKRASETTSVDTHSTKMLDVSKSELIPEIVKMQVVNEPMDMGYNLNVQVRHWSFTPEAAGNAVKENQGHLHVYINGQKAGRMYSEWFFLGKLKPGTNKIAVTLNGDDHTAFTVNGKMIGAEIALEVP
ncbi:MAG: hypothetical protein AAF789_00060 [Bacteroidota bacterium]